ncbi:MAG: hypothetical protein CL583_16000 [Alteromonadaceae bacterium]|nr:hypothetical protein [Alteromonadaceae bacterium]
MIRAPLLATALIAALTASVSGPAFAASGGEEEKKAPVDEASLPHVVTLPGSYVALPEAFVTRIRDRILAARGEKPAGHETKKPGGH